MALMFLIFLMIPLSSALTASIDKPKMVLYEELVIGETIEFENSVIVNERIIPKQLSINKFQRWLANNRAFSENFQDIRVKVSIEPEKYS